MQAYRIVDWWQYEVTAKGRKAKQDTPIEELRKAPLDYIRFPVMGHDLSAAFRRLVKRSWSHGDLMAAACIGFYKMLLGLAGNQEREYRGYILDDRQRPINPMQIAELLTLTTEQIENVFEVLMDESVRWVELVDFPESLQSEDSKSADFKMGKIKDGYKPPGFSGSGGVSKGDNREALNETVPVDINKKINETKRNVENVAYKPPGFSGSDGVNIGHLPSGVWRESPTAQPPPPGTDTDSNDTDSEKISATDTCSVSDSVSSAGAVPWAGLAGKERIFEITRQCNIAVFNLSEIISFKTGSDRTTVSNIFEQIKQRIISGLDEDLFSMSLSIARECVRVADKPMAMFVDAMKKKPFCYVPRKITLTKDKFYKH